MIKAALTGKLNKVEFHNHPIFGLAMPKTCPDVPNAVLNPNFKKYSDKASAEIVNAGPALV